MSAKIRLFEPNQVYETSIRTVDRTFLFAPNHRKGHPLLAKSSAPNALDPRIDVMPESSIINNTGASVGRALANHPIQLHSFESNINHLHITFSVDEQQLDNIVPFFQNALSLIARGINRIHDREGHVFGGRARHHPCLDDDTAAQKYLYGLTNAQKDNLIDRTSSSPFFTTFNHQAKGKDLKYWFIDYDSFWTAGGKRKKSHRLKDYLKWIDWQCSPLPHQQSMTISQRQTWMRKQVKALEDARRKERKENGLTVIGEKKLRDTDPRDRPNNPKKSGKEPLCHASDKETAKEYVKKWKAFRDEHIKASADYRNGMLDREFPVGSFRPPLLGVCGITGA